VLSQSQIRVIQPGILINDRQHGKGDFSTQFECGIPEKRPAGLWEHCFSMVDAWGYLETKECSPAALLLTRLVKCRAWGGNVLANFAPRPTGEMPDSVYRCLADVQAWMTQRRESVIGVQPGPYPEQSNVPVTVRCKRWYLHLIPKTADGPAFEGPITLTGVGRPQNVAILGTGHVLTPTLEGDRLTISVPKELRTESVDVVAVDW
jgi:alpha-L-fucosidase